VCVSSWRSVIGPLAGRTFGAPAGVEAFEDRGRAQRRVDVGDRSLERELALLDELHGRDGGDRLGHRGDAEDGVGGHRRRLVEPAEAERALVQHALVGRGHRHDAGHVLGVHRLFQDAVDARATAGLGVSPAGGRGGADRAAAARAAVPFSTSRRLCGDVMA
jgi:hypothetical protein